MVFSTLSCDDFTILLSHFHVHNYIFLVKIKLFSYINSKNLR